MRRWSLFLLTLIATAPVGAVEFGPPTRVADFTRDAYAPLTVQAIVSDGNGGGVAFSWMSRANNSGSDIIATPIDANGTPHAEKAVVVSNAQGSGSLLGAAKTANGYLVSFSDGEGGHVAALRNDLSTVTRNPLPVVVWNLACSGDVCAGVNRDGLLLLDPTGRLLERVTFPGARRITAVDGGFAVVALHERSAAADDIEVAFLQRTGRTTASATFAIPYAYGQPAIVVPHPLGAAAFWPEGDWKNVNAAVVRTDGTIVATAKLPVGQIAGPIVVAANGNQFGVLFTGKTPSLCMGCVQDSVVYGFRLSDRLQPLTPLTLLNAAKTIGDEPVIAASGNGFIAGWQHWVDGVRGSRSLRISAAGVMNANASTPLALAPASQVGVAIAAAADRTLALWSSFTADGTARLYGARFDRFGTRLDAAPIPIFKSAYGTADSDGHHFMATVYDQSGPSLRLVSVDGDDGKARLLPFAGDGYMPIVWDGSGYARLIFNDQTLERVTPDGKVLWRKQVSMKFPFWISALPGRILVLGTNREHLNTYEIYDSAGKLIAAKMIGTSYEPYPFIAFSNRRDQFLVLARDSIKGDGSTTMYATRITAEGTELDRGLVRIDGKECFSRAVALGNHWLLFRDGEVIEFPGFERHALPPDETVVAAIPSAEGKAMILTRRSAVVEGVSVGVLSVREVTDSGATPPRRRNVKR